MRAYPAQWKQLHDAVQEGRLPQALLFVGPLHCALSEFTTELMQLIFCQNNINKPCYECLDCKMAAGSEHPDIEWIRPDKNGGAIKIDQIRGLQSTVYQTPQRSTYRLVAIDAADRMNTAAANSLLKVLEEPPSHTLFILVAQQISTIIPTIISRCQLLRFSSSEDSSTSLLMLGEQYPEDSERSVIVTQSETILDGLISLIEGKKHPCVLAAEWGQYELDTVLWFLYLVFAQIQYLKIDEKSGYGPGQLHLQRLALLLNPLLVFSQIEKVNTLLRKLSHNITINRTLALEDLLFSFI